MHQAAQQHHLEVDFDNFAEQFGLAGATEFFTELHRGNYVKAVTGHDRQVAAAKAIDGAQVIESLGAVPKATIDAASFHYWGQTLGYECWEDEEFIQEYLRDNPLARPRMATRTAVILNQWGQPARAAA